MDHERRVMRTGLTVGFVVAALIVASGVALGELGEPVCFDDFDEASSGWDVGTSDAGTMEYRNGSFRIRMTQMDELLWSRSPCGSVPDSFVLEATAGTRHGINPAAWGLIWGIDDENLLVLLVTPAGRTTVRSMRNGKWQPPPIPWTESHAVDRGDGVPNTLRATVDGDTVTVRINNHDIGHFETGDRPDLAFGLLEGADETSLGPVSLADGSKWLVGIVAGSFEQTPVELDFDSFGVYDLP